MAFKTTFPLNWGQKQQDEFSVTVQRSMQYASGRLTAHWHDCFELLYITEGSRSFTAGGQSFLLDAGDILILPPHILHSSDGGIYQSIVFGYAESVIHTPHNSYLGIQYLLPFRDAPAVHMHSTDPAAPQLQTLLKQGAGLADDPAPTRSLEMRACILLVHAIIWKLYLIASSGTEKTCEYLSHIQAYIEDHLTQDISPYGIAQALHISHSHLCRIVKQAYRLTPTALINRSRLCLAEHLLLYMPALPITEIASQTGFSDDSYFIRLFKKEYGITPKQFRSNYSLITTQE